LSQTTDSRLGRDTRALDEHAEMVASLLPVDAAPELEPR
jgi:hypothetical protein